MSFESDKVYLSDGCDHQLRSPCISLSPKFSPLAPEPCSPSVPPLDLYEPDFWMSQHSRSDTVDPLELHSVTWLSETGHSSHTPTHSLDYTEDHYPTEIPSREDCDTRTSIGAQNLQHGDEPTPSQLRKRFSLTSVRILNKWLASHTHHPYPTVRDVEAIERQTGLRKQQILNWFANARRRKKFYPTTTSNLTSESSGASPRDIPSRRPSTPFVGQQTPLERWQNSPPEDEPSSVSDIARAISDLELDYFFSSYVDVNQCAPPDRLLHLEACCIIFGAEFLQRPLQTNASSWLRDLLMGTEDIAEEARMRPMKNAARSRFTDLRIHGKIDIFEDCQLETSLHQYVDVLQLLSLKIGDDELQREACSIINHMPNASPMFINLLTRLVYGSTIWLTPFRLRMGMPTVEASPRPTDIDASPVVDFESLADLADIQASDVGNQRTSANEDAIEQMNSCQPIGCGVDVDTGTGRMISVNDGSIYRGLTRDLSRFVASAMSPLNPTRRIPTDGELQFQARWIEYNRYVAQAHTSSES
ncbi:hypothetical protein FDECE_5651 [Fusarium decemcellulare]|nr:hypothetical protein FDECE_5651 [Fusarium decemcellulare]